MYYNARYYDKHLGALVSPDPLIPDPTDIASYNRYLYANGNPIKYNDPSGHQANEGLVFLHYADQNDGYPIPDSWPGSPDEFFEARNQYWAYEATPDLYWLDIAIGNGEFAGDVEAANRRHALAYAYSSYIGQVEHISIAMSDSPDLWGAAMMELYSPGPLIAAGLSVMATIGTPIWTPGRPGSSVRNALDHYHDHGADFPEVNNALGYLRMTHEFTRNPPDTALIKSRTRNGDIVIYDPPSNTIAFTNKYGVPKSMYRPDPAKHGYPTNLDYFMAQ